MCRLLINEKTVSNIMALVSLAHGKLDTSKAEDLFKEVYYRTLNREQQYYKDKAKDIIKMYKMTQEGKDFINKK